MVIELRLTNRQQDMFGNQVGLIWMILEDFAFGQVRSVIAEKPRAYRGTSAPWRMRVHEQLGNWDTEPERPSPLQNVARTPPRGRTPGAGKPIASS
jgi:hypothetical protein